MLPTVESPTHGRAAVLCVDDEVTLLDFFTRVLSPEFRVVLAHDGATALELLGGCGPFAVVVSDLSMPGMSGSTFLAEVRSRDPQTVRVMLSGCDHVGGATEVVATVSFQNDGTPPGRVLQNHSPPLS